MLAVPCSILLSAVLAVAIEKAAEKLVSNWKLDLFEG
jgi:hypothetical protein